MATRRSAANRAPMTLAKAPTGIEGFDEITSGGLPRGRGTLVCGGAGCGKTLFGTEFLVRGATQFDEPGVLLAFEIIGDLSNVERVLVGLDVRKPARVITR